MPDWLAEPNRLLYVLLAAGGLVCVVLFSKTRRRPWLAAAVVFAALFLALLICDRLYQSDGEQIAAALQSMAVAVHDRNLDRVFTHISDQFSVQSANKAAFRRFCDGHQFRWNITELVIWDFQLLDKDAARERAECRFQFKIRAEQADLLGGGFYWCRAIFVRDVDGQWRMQTFTIYPPTGMDQPILVPGL